MANEKIRIGLIGTGRIGQVHAGSIAESQDAEITWIADTFIEGAEKTAAQYGGKITDNPADIFASGEVDAVVIASPTPTHIDLISNAIDAGVHVLCEKPIDLDIARVDSLRDKAANAKINIALGFNRRFDQNFNRLHARVQAGDIGRLEQLTIMSRDPAPAPQAYIAVSGGIFRDMTIHDFDMTRFFVPKIVEVTARGANSFSDYIKEEDDFDSVVVIMRGANDELISVTNSRHASYGYDQRVEAFGDKGMLYASNVQSNTVKFFGANEVESSDPYMEFFLERYAFSYRRELALFVEGIRTGKQLNPGFEDGRAALLLANAADESARTGKSVAVSV
jgi:myo-inositol 2-dehydrogenase/D-chiro-inositol 1-dehydrogenase